VALDVNPRRRGRPSLVRKAEGLIRRDHLFPAGNRGLVMVSGGQDSIALVHLLTAGLPPTIRPASVHALHINHHLRGRESDDDEALVVAACASLGVDLTVLHRPIEKRYGNVQEAAREARREAALTTAVEKGCDRIAVGHTADDQVETMLYRLGRYGGMAAYAGMGVCDPPWVRPLLGCRRSETAAYCRDLGLSYAEDRGNAYPGYARTALRERVLPEWEKALPGAVEAACRAAEVAAEMQALAAMVLAEVGVGIVPASRGEGAAGADAPSEVEACEGAPTGAAFRGAVPELSASFLQALSAPVRRLFLHQWLEACRRAAASRASVLAVEALLAVPGSGRRALGGGVSACKEYDRVYLEPQPPRQGRGQPGGTPQRFRARRAPAGQPGPVGLPVPGQVEWGGVLVRAERVERFEAPDVLREAYIDADTIDGPLVVRGPLPGDRLRPLGAPGTRKLADVLGEARVPAKDRPLRPLVVCGRRIVWVSGLVLAEECRITRGTASLLRLSLGPKQDRRGVAGGDQSEEGERT